MTSYSLGLIGFPVSHSLSPIIHHYFLAKAGLAGDYALISLEAEKLEQSFHDWKCGGTFTGLNVTIPYKVRVIDLLDELDNDALCLGAVNTIHFDGVLKGHNTDAYGFSQSLSRNSLVDSSRTKALIYGNGGAARAVLLSLVESGYKEISILGRDNQKVERFISSCTEQIAKGKASLSAKFKSSNDEQFDLIVNCAPLGQVVHEVPKNLLDVLRLQNRENVFVIDLVYSKSSKVPTLLQSSAMELGITSVDGLEMLIYQAAKAFQIWTGNYPSSDQIAELKEKITTGGDTPF